MAYVTVLSICLMAFFKPKYKRTAFEENAAVAAATKVGRDDVFEAADDEVKNPSIA